MQLLEIPMDGTTLFMIYVAATIIVFIIFYYIIKSAVKFGTIEAMQEINKVSSPANFQKVEDNLPNTAQGLLQKKYDKGEISFDEYKTEWAKLK